MAPLLATVSLLCNVVICAYALAAAGIVASCVVTAALAVARDVSAEIRAELRYDAGMTREGAA